MPSAVGMLHDTAVCDITGSNMTVPKSLYWVATKNTAAITANVRSSMTTRVVCLANTATALGVGGLVYTAESPENALSPTAVFYEGRVVSPLCGATDKGAVLRGVALSVPVRRGAVCLVRVRCYGTCSVNVDNTRSVAPGARLILNDTAIGVVLVNNGPLNPLVYLTPQCWSASKATSPAASPPS